MTASKTATLNLRITPVLKQALRNAAEREQRSLANMVEVMIRNYSETHGWALPDSAEKPKSENPPK